MFLQTNPRRLQQSIPMSRFGVGYVSGLAQESDSSPIIIDRDFVRNLVRTVLIAIATEATLKLIFRRRGW